MKTFQDFPQTLDVRGRGTPCRQCVLSREFSEMAKPTARFSATADALGFAESSRLKLAVTHNRKRVQP